MAQQFALVRGLSPEECDAAQATRRSTWARSYGHPLLLVTWLAALALARSRDVKVVGEGAEEYSRVARASKSLFGIIAIAAFLLKIDLARGYLAVALPLGLTLLVLSRWCWRRWLRLQRAQGRHVTTVLVVGSHQAAASMANTFEQAGSASYRVAGVCVPGWGRAKAPRC